MEALKKKRSTMRRKVTILHKYIEEEGVSSLYLAEIENHIQSIEGINEAISELQEDEDTMKDYELLLQMKKMKEVVAAKVKESSIPVSVTPEPKKKQKRTRITKDLIGMPTNFQHVSYVGSDLTKGFDYDLDNLDPNLKEFLKKAELSARDLQDETTREFIYEFLDQHGGIDAVIQAVTQPEPPRVPTRNARSTPRLNRPVPRSRALPTPPSSMKPSVSPKNQGYGAPPPPPPLSTLPSRGGQPPPPSSNSIPPPMPAGGSAPPPPPPPASIGVSSTSSLPAVDDGRNALLDSIRKGRSLKHVDAEERKSGDDSSSNSGGSRNELLDQIRQGVGLKSLDNLDLKDFLKQAVVSAIDLQDERTREFIYEFLDQHGGIDAVIQAVTQPEPPPVPTRNTSSTPSLNRPVPAPRALHTPPSVLPMRSNATVPPKRIQQAPHPPPSSMKPSVSPKNQGYGAPPPPLPLSTLPSRGGGQPPPPPPPPSSNSIRPPMPAGGSAPPPPPPPASIGVSSTSSLPAVDDGRNALLDSIRKGRSLKVRVVAGGAPPPPPPLS